MKALIAPMTLAVAGGPYKEILQKGGFELVYPSKPMQLTEDEILAALKGVSAVVAGSEPYTPRVIEANPTPPRVIEANPTLRVIARAGVGYDAVNLAAANQRGVVVTTTPGTNHDAVAEHTFTLILGVAKGVVPQHFAMKSGQWPRGANIPLR